MDQEKLAEALNISLVAPAILNASLVKHMTEGSSIIFVGSTLSEKAVHGRMSYVTVKHGMVGMMRSCAQDLFGMGIHTACICPGFTNTPMLQDAMAKGGDDAQRFIENFVSLRRLLTSEEIARALVFAVENPSVNGSVIHVNGGQRES